MSMPIHCNLLCMHDSGVYYLCHKFKYKACELECVQHCKYLSVYFSASGTFSYAQDELNKKSQKDFLSLNPKPKTSIHIFDHTIKPIVLYGCEIWGNFNSNTARFRNETLSPYRIYSNLICEKLHTKFCKFILGVHKKPTNFAVLSELGRFPLYYDIIKSIFHYWNRLEYLKKIP